MALYDARRRGNAIVMGLCVAASAFGLAFLVLILGALLWKGLAGLTLVLFTEMTPPPGSSGGLLNAILGSLIVTVLGVVWAAWHLPLFFIRGTDTTGGSFPVYLITVTAISIAMGWLYARTSGSLLLVMLMHSAANNTPHFVPAATPGSVFAVNATMVQWLTALFLWIGAGYLLVRMRRRPTRPIVEAGEG